MRNGRRSGIGLLASEDRFEGSLQTAMRIPQRDDALGDDVVLLEHLVHRERLFARKLSVHISHQQLVAELGHDGVSSG